MVVSGKIIPSPRGLPIIGTMASFIGAGGAKKLHEYVDRRHRELGPIYREKIGPVACIFLSNPDHIRKLFATEGRYPRHIIPESWALFNDTFNAQRGLLFMEGEEWYKYRSILNSVLLKPEPSYMVENMSFAADSLISQWRNCNEPKNFEEQLYRWSLENILTLLLSAEDYQKIRLEIAPIVDKVSYQAHQVFVESSTLSMMPAKLAKTLRLPTWKRFVKAVNGSVDAATTLLAKVADSCKEGSKLHQLKTAGLQKNELLRLVTDVIIAAGDTTVYTVQWLLYLLSKHPQIQADIYEAIKDIDVATAIEHNLIKGALRETLRLYPVAPFITRYPPINVDMDGYVIPKDELVIVSLYTSGRLETCFPQPLEFQPSRWTRDGRCYMNVRNSQASLPFAMGARSCLGRKIAEASISILLTKLLKEFTVMVKNTKEVDIELKMITTPAEPIYCHFQTRN